MTVGDGNQINVKFREAAQALSELTNAIARSNELEVETKLEIATDIDSIQDQLVKPRPNATVIKTLWNVIEKITTIGALAGLVQKVSPLIAGLIG